MKITLTSAQLTTLKAFLDHFEDCEALSEGEYVLDLYDLEPPLSIDMTFHKNGIEIEGAAELLFDEEMEGWYIGNRIEDTEPILCALYEMGALEK